MASSDLPVGTILPFAGQDPEALASRGWILCDGRLLIEAEHPELYAAIGEAWGAPGPGLFNAPDLRGLFLRTVAPDAARDPDRAARRPLKPGGSERGVGSYQDYGTAPPREPFTASLPNHASACESTAIGCEQERVACPGGGEETVGVASGGDIETRPKNKYVYFIVQSAAEVDGQPVEPPVGSLAPFAGQSEADVGDRWLPCEGQALEPFGVFEALFESLGFAHGSEGEGEGERFLLPDYRGYFLRGVSGMSDRDPETLQRGAPHEPTAEGRAGNSGNAVGSTQGQATAQPIGDDLLTEYPLQPTETAEKTGVGTQPPLFKLNTGCVTATLSEAGGDEETRPDNVRVAWHIRLI